MNKGAGSLTAGLSAHGEGAALCVSVFRVSVPFLTGLIRVTVMGMGRELPVASVRAGRSLATFLLHGLQDAPGQRRRQALLRHHRRQGAVLER